MLKKEVLYSLDDVTILPSVTSDIRHRGEINSYYNIDNRNVLPIFVSPMECVINKNNFSIYERNNVIPILPRTETIDVRLEYAKSNKWASFGLDEFETYFCDDENLITERGMHVRALIDIANGHIKLMQDIIRKSKEVASKNEYVLEVMAGNIANPLTYVKLAEAGADFVRCAVGTGNCCITASNTATYMPMASLIDECYKYKTSYNLNTKIIADGGISSYSRAIKALALGADFVMIGSSFGKCFESSSDFISVEKPIKAYTYYSLNELNNMRYDNNISDDEKKEIIKMYAPMNKAVWGMSTRRAQTSIAVAQGKNKNEIKTKTSEGVEKLVTVDYTLHQWLENFNDYLRSSMSYCNCRLLSEFVGKPSMKLLSESSRNAINK